MTKATQSKVVLATGKAEAGVDYSARRGAECPWCGKKAKIYSTKPWEDNIRIRYHHCTNSRCVLAAMGKSIKSIEVDMVAVS